MPGVPRIALGLDQARISSRQILRGIARYAHAHGPWRFVTAPPFYHRRLVSANAAEWSATDKTVDGVIAYVHDNNHAEPLRQLGKPAIVIPVKERIDGLPNFLGDSEAASAMAAQHLLERGLRHFAFCGLDGLMWSRDRRQAFTAFLARYGHDVTNYDMGLPNVNPTPPSEQHRLMAWLEALPKPVGIMTWNDECGRDVIEACLAAQIRVPEDVAVVGVDNDDLICDLLDIPLSSVIINFYRAGYETAELLARALGGEDISGQGLWVKPVRVIARKSTDIMAITDAEVAEALRFIHQQANHRTSVAEVAAAVCVSQRTLQKRFQAVLGRTIHQEICRRRIQKATQMLENTTLKIAQIAKSLGYSEATDFNRSFRKVKGMTPSEYRHHATHV